MVSGPSFYIYGGGRWREVDISDGRVEGWGRAKFVYAKRGKVNLAKTKSVLAALRDLKVGKKSSIKDGAHLPHKNVASIEKKGRYPETSKCDDSLYFHRPNNNRVHPFKIGSKPVVKPAKQNIAKARQDAAIQTSLPSQTLTFPNYHKQKSDKRRETTSSIENLPIKVHTTAIVNSSPNKLMTPNLKERRLADDGSPKKVPSLKLHRADSTKYNLYKRQRRNSSDSLVWVVLPKNEENNKKTLIYDGSKYIQHEPDQMTEKNRRESTCSNSSWESQPQNDVDKSKLASINAMKKDYGKPKTSRSFTSPGDNSVIPNSQLHSKSILNAEQAKPASQDKFKELIICEEDVEVLRNYLVHNSTNFDLLKFDDDDEYKRQFFYTINPLVNVERCPKIAAMLRKYSQSDLSLKDFASQLGLTSISETREPQRYKIRKRNTNKAEKIHYESDTVNAQELKNRVYKGGDDDRCKKYSTDSEAEIDLEELRRRSSRRVVGHTSKINLRKSVRGVKINSKAEVYSDRDCSGQPIRNTVRNIRRRSAVLDLTYTTDSEGKEEPSKKIQQIKTRKIINRNQINSADIAKPEDEDSDWGVEADQKSSTSTCTLNNTISKEESAKITKKGEQNKKKVNTKRNNKHIFKRPRQRRKNGQYLGFKSAKRRKSTSDSIDDSSDEKSVEEVTKKEQKRNKRNDTKKNIESTEISNIETEKARKPNQNGRFSEVYPNKERKVKKSDNSYDSSDEKSNGEVSKRDRHSKRNTKQTDNTTDSDEENFVKTTKISNTPKNRDRKDETKSKKDNNAEAGTAKKSFKKEVNKHNINKTAKQTLNRCSSDEEIVNESPENSRPHFNRTIKGKKNVIQSSIDSSDEENNTFETVQTRNQKNNWNTSKNKSAESNVEKFKLKSKIIRLNDTNGASKIESQIGVKNERKNKLNDIKRNINDQNNNMTDSNDENSDVEEHRRETGRKETTHKVRNAKNAENYTKEKQVIKKNIDSVSTETLHLSDTVKDHVFTKPVIGEVKSLAVIPRQLTGGTASSVSSVQRVEYSNLEDHAIVTWISLGGRAQCVNGNHIWRELQDQYYSISGQYRTWHSLRNRYLRYILPRLGELALNQSLITRLRAAAATGKLKSRKDSSRRNSIFGAPPIPGALSRQPRAVRSSSTEMEPPMKKHKSDHTRKSPSPVPKVLRSSLHSSPKKADRSLRYSQITRQFAAKYNASTSSSSITSSDRSPRKRSLSSKNLLQTKNATKSSLETKKSDKNVPETKIEEKSLETKSTTKTFSDNKKSLSLIRTSFNTSLPNSERKTRGSPTGKSSTPTEFPNESRRKSLRNKSPAQKANEKSPAEGRMRTRRLFNPNTMI